MLLSLHQAWKQLGHPIPMVRWTFVHYVLYQMCENAVNRRQREGSKDTKQYISGNVVEFDRILEGLKRGG